MIGSGSPAAAVASVPTSGWPTTTFWSRACPLTTSASISCTSGTKLGQAGMVVQGVLVAGSIDDSEPSVATSTDAAAMDRRFDDRRIAVGEAQRHVGRRRRRAAPGGSSDRPASSAGPTIRGP